MFYIFLSLNLLVYIFIGTCWGLFLYRNFDRIYDEPGAVICGTFWIITMPVIIPIFLGVRTISFIDRALRPNKGWTSRN